MCAGPDTTILHMPHTTLLSPCPANLPYRSAARGGRFLPSHPVEEREGVREAGLVEASELGNHSSHNLSVFDRCGANILNL